MPQDVEFLARMSERAKALDQLAGKLKLRPRQRRFAEIYLSDGRRNATRCAERAGYTGAPQTLGQTGHQLLKNKKVREYMGALVHEAKEVTSTKRHIMSEAEVLSAFTDMAQSIDISEYVDLLPDGRHVINLHRLAASGKGHLVRSIKHDAAGDAEIKLYDRHRALVELKKHYTPDRATETQVVQNNHVTMFVSALGDDMLAQLEAARRQLTDGSSAVDAEVVQPVDPKASGDPQ